MTGIIIVTVTIHYVIQYMLGFAISALKPQFNDSGGISNNSTEDQTVSARSNGDHCITVIVQTARMWGDSELCSIHT